MGYFNSRIPPPVNSQHGGSLIEILISLLLVAFGFLGIGAMLNYSTAANKNASSRLAASMLAQDYADMARANPSAFAAGKYDQSLQTYDPNSKNVTAVSSSDKCAFPACTSDSLATNDKALFRQRVKALLPAGDFVATKAAAGNTNAMDIWILWVEGRNTTEPNTGSDICPSTVTGATKPNPFPRCLYARIAL